MTPLTREQSDHQIAEWKKTIPPAPSTFPQPEITLANCHAVLITFEPGLTQLVMWRDGPRLWRPVKAGQSIRDLRAGDRMVNEAGVVEVVRRVEVYR